MCCHPTIEYDVNRGCVPLYITCSFSLVVLNIFSFINSSEEFDFDVFSCSFFFFSVLEFEFFWIDQPPPVTYQPQQTERNQSLLVPANPYHTAEIPDWLQVYARAPVK